MFKSVKHKLILLYTGSTGLILTAVLVFVFIITQNQMLENQKETFMNSFYNVSKQVQINNQISNLWLAEFEIKGKFIASIEDNGKPLLYNGSWQTPTDRTILINSLKKKAKKDNIDTDLRPISVNEIESRIYRLQGQKQDQYLGAVFMVRIGSGYRSVILLQYISENKAADMRLKVLMIFLDIAGIIAFYYISKWIVSKSLKPVEESRRRQTEFIAAASHELKSPLTVIRANTSALLIEPEKTEHFKTGIEKECMRLSGLIEDMLLLASVDSSKWSMKNELVDMDTLLIDIYDSYYPVFKERGMELKLTLQEDILPKVEGDPLRIRQIVEVILDNAKFYTKEKDMVVLRTCVKKNHLIIEIEDHGIGIAKDKKEEIFGRFYREDKSRKDKNHFGLGLSIAKELVELHNGKISVKDTIGGGATFLICFPAAK